MFCLLSVMCSRVYLAAHTINQIVFGAAIGLEIAVFMHYSVKPQLYAHMMQLSSVSPRNTDYTPLVRNASIVFAMSQLLPFLVYWYVANYTTVPQQYLDNLMAHCPPDTKDKVFHERAFPYIGKTALGYFAYLGTLVHHKWLTSNTTN